MQMILEGDRGYSDDNDSSSSSSASSSSLTTDIQSIL